MNKSIDSIDLSLISSNSFEMDNSVVSINRSHTRIQLQTNIYRIGMDSSKTQMYLYSVKTLDNPFQAPEVQFIFHNNSFIAALTKEIGPFIAWNNQILTIYKAKQRVISLLICSKEDVCTINSCRERCSSHIMLNIHFRRAICFDSVSTSSSRFADLYTNIVKQALRKANFIFNPAAKIFFKSVFNSKQNYPFKLNCLQLGDNGCALRLSMLNNLMAPCTFESAFNWVLEECKQNVEVAREKFLSKYLYRSCFSLQDSFTYKVIEIEFDCSLESKKTTLRKRKISLYQYYQFKYGIAVKECPFLITARKSKANEISYLLPNLSGPAYSVERSKTSSLSVEEVFERQKYQIKQIKEALIDTCQVEVEPVSVYAKLQPFPVISVSKSKTQFIPSSKGALNYENFSFANKIVFSNFLLIYYKDEEKAVTDFWLKFKARANAMQILTEDNPLKAELPVTLRNSEDLFKAKIKQICSVKYKIIFFFFRGEPFYKAFKQGVNAGEHPTSSQCVNFNNFTGDGVKRKLSSLAVQIVCKMGIVPWKIKNLLADLPENEQNMLVCSYSVGTFSRDDQITGFTSLVGLISQSTFTKKVYFDSEHDDFNGYSSKIAVLFGKLLRSMQRSDIALPKVILVYRKGNFKDIKERVKQEEFAPIMTFCKAEFGDELKFVFVFVEPKAKVRFFNVQDNYVSNSAIGTTIEDTIITQKDSFYLVNHQGYLSAEPTLFTVVNCSELDTKSIQKITFWLCFLYFNVDRVLKIPGIVANIERRVKFIREILMELPKGKYRKYDISM